MQEVKIIKIYLLGVRNSYIKVVGTYTNELNLTLLGDNETLNYDLKINSNEKSFVLETETKNIKKIVLLQNEKEILKIKNSIYKRVFSKIKTTIINAYNKIIYSENEFVGIRNISIENKKNPVVKIEGTILIDKFEFYLVGNNKKTKLNVIKKGSDFYITEQLDKKDKFVYLMLKAEGKEYLVAKIKNKKNTQRKKYQIHDYRNITFNDIILGGIISPGLIITGYKTNKESKMIIKSNNKIIDYENNQTQKEEEFCYYVKLPKKSKKIECFLDNELVLTINNSLIYRLVEKIKFIFKRIGHYFYVFYRGIRASWKQYHFLIPPRLWKKYWIELKNKIRSQENGLFLKPDDIKDYNKWLKDFEIEENKMNFEYNPLISLLIPVYNINREYLSECIDSILSQSYDNFEICLVDDASTKQETIETLKEYEKKDKRIKVKYRKKNGHISNTTNDALKMSTGEFIGLVDNDDLLASNALYEVVKALNENKKLDFIYSDEDKLNQKGERCYPHFKPDFSPDTLLSLNYICHFTVIRKKLVEKVGGFEVGLEGAQDHDLFLKVTEKTKNIYHIPKILYHWRMIEGSTAANLDNKSYANDKGKIAIENALKRRKILGHVEKDEPSTYYKVVYEYKKEPSISIIIPTRDYADTLKTCLDSIYQKTTYKNFEIIIANNGSVEKNTFELFDKYKKEHNNFKVIDVNTEFNYSYINNYAIKKAKGDYIVLLNNDTEIITPNWLDIMVGYASQKHIGTVGVKLLYPDKTVQHAGVILGLGGVASHAYIGSSRNDLGMYGRLRVPYDYAAVTAACLMVSKKKYNEVNGLEEDLKVAYNDVDFNIKLLEKGYYNIFLPQVELIHFESKSRGYDTTTEKYKRFLKESEYMYKKWKNVLDNDKMYNKNFSKKGWFVLDKTKKGKNLL